MKRLATLVLALVCSLFVIISHVAAEPAAIILDTDMGLDPEDMNSLALLHALADNGEAEILATIACGYEMNRASGATIDAMNTFHGRPDIPVATTRFNQVFSKWAIPISKSPYTSTVRDTHPHDTPVDDRCESAVRMYRKVLSAQPDNSVTIVTVGWLNNLRDLLLSEPDSISKLSGRELVAQKVKELSAMGGAFPNGWEYNFSFAGMHRTTEYVLEHWPSDVPIVMSGVEIGLAIVSGERYEADLADGPLRTGLGLAFNALRVGRPSWDETAVLYAVRGLSHDGEEYWTTVSEGSISINPLSGDTTWVASPDGNQSYLIQVMDPEAMGAMMEDLIISSTKKAAESKR
jgi:inosine-uridine nucleoside N-ribohydrolase